MIKALADRFAEAFAEYLHAKVRREWGYGKDENLTNEQMIDEAYDGIRPAFGYPSCPDHLPKGPLWRLLDAEKATGMTLTSSFAMWPAASVSGLYFSLPDRLIPGSKYFAVDRITQRSGRGLRSSHEHERQRHRTLAGTESGVQSVVYGFVDLGNDVCSIRSLRYDYPVLNLSRSTTFKAIQGIL